MIKYIKIDDSYHLTEIRESDIDALVNNLNNINIFNNTLVIPYPYTRPDAEWFVNFCREQEVQYNQVVNWAIRNTEGVLIGGIGRFMKTELSTKHKDEIGYWLGQPYHNRGIMSSVVKVYCEYLFETCQVQRIEAVVFPHNVASMKVLTNAGFEKEAYCRKYHVKQGQAIDGVMYVNIR